MQNKYTHLTYIPLDFSKLSIDFHLTRKRIFKKKPVIKKHISDLEKKYIYN